MAVQNEWQCPQCNRDYVQAPMEWVEKELDYYLGKTDQFSYQTRPWVPPWAS